MKRLQEALENRTANYIFPFFWQHGEEEDVLREYMNAIHNASIGAVCVESRPHPDFCGPKWWKDMDVILDEAEKLGMKVWILDDSHFPTGYANGAMKDAPDELTHQYMVYRSLEISGPARHLELNVKEYMEPEPLPPWMPPAPPAQRQFHDDELVAVLACPILEMGELGTPVDLTPKMDDQMKIDFDLGDGFWKIFVVYLTRKAKGRNDYINFLDKDSCRILIDAVYEPHYAHYSRYFGNVIAGFFSDEPPVGNTEGYMPAGPIGSPGQNLPWSKAAGPRFTEEFGSEEWKLYLPYLWGEAGDKVMQAKERVSFMQMASRLVQECFSEQNGSWCKEHGVEYIGHMLEDCDFNSDLGISLGHFFRGLAGQHMAGIDNIGGQVMINGQHAGRRRDPRSYDEAGFYHYVLGKLGASLAAIDPDKLGRCLCENFGAYGWQSGTKEQKFMADHFMVRGVNHFVPHAFTPKAFPDPDCPPHFYAHGENPLYGAFGKLMAYTNRVCHLINGGRPCPDAAILYNGESRWAGCGMPNVQAARALTNAQVDFHIIPSDVFDNTDEYPSDFDGKILTVNGVEYRALVISGCTFIQKSAAEFLAKAKESGFPVLFLDQKPSGVSCASAEENEAFVRMIADYETIPASEAAGRLKEVLIPQVQAEPAFSELVSYHYQQDGDLYLLLNEGAEKSYEGNVEIQKKGVPFRYYPWENRLEAVEYEETEKGLKVKLVINPLELCVLAVSPLEGCLNGRKAEGGETLPKPPVYGQSRELTSFMVYQVNSRDYLMKNGVKACEPFAAEAPFAGMQKKYPDFSGFYIYETKTDLIPGRQYLLEIEDVYESAEVFVNGTGIGTKLQKPFRFTIPSELSAPESTIRIEIATLLERKIHSGGFNMNGMTAFRPLSATGIVGKVTLREEIQ